MDSCSSSLNFTPRPAFHIQWFTVSLAFCREERLASACWVAVLNWSIPAAASPMVICSAMRLISLMESSISPKWSFRLSHTALSIVCAISSAVALVSAMTFCISSVSYFASAASFLMILARAVPIKIPAAPPTPAPIKAPSGPPTKAPSPAPTVTPASALPPLAFFASASVVFPALYAL